MQRIKSVRGALLAIGLIALPTTAVVAASPEAKCEADKNKIAGKYAFCRQKAEAKAVKTGNPADYTKCDGKLLDKWDKANAKAVSKGTSCHDSLTANDVQSFLTDQSDEIAAALAGGGSLSSGCGLLATGQTTSYGSGTDGDLQLGTALAFVDNGDGTITDLNTGLMWEKKDDSGSGVHDVDNRYKWTSGTNDLDGTVVTDFLDVLNDTAGGGASCFAGHCDWRLPNRRELDSTIDLELSGPAQPAAFHSGACTGCTDATSPACSCTNLQTGYMSSTTVIYSTGEFWTVIPFSGMALPFGKTGDFAARAVRGGGAPSSE